LINRPAGSFSTPNTKKEGSMKNSKKIFYLICCVLTLCFAGCKPSVTIISPTNGAIFEVGKTITFEGKATDQQHPDLGDDSFVWTSDKDGEIGTGASFTSADLSEGQHTITLTVTDPSGQSGHSSVTITVGNVTTTTTTGGGATTTTITTSTDTDVYVSGWEAKAGNLIAKYWVNGDEVNLTDGKTMAEARSIFVSGSDVYVAGYDFVEGIQTAIYWKNGEAVHLTTGSFDQATYTFSGESGWANSIFVSGSDVYVAGYKMKLDKNGPSTFEITYWKNGQSVLLENTLFMQDGPDGLTGYVGGRSIFVSGSDVYVAGCNYETKNGTTYYKQKYWKNGTAYDLKDEKYTYTEANQLYTLAGNIYVSGSDVYVPGYTYWREPTSASFVPHSIAKYWKNGKEIILDENTSDLSGAFAIFLEGNDVYVLGRSNYKITYWKNGTPFFELDGGSSSNAFDLMPNSALFVLDSDVYVAGRSRSLQAVYMKNSDTVELTKGAIKASATGIYVVKK
jgi:hypothetical protein